MALHGGGHLELKKMHKGDFWGIFGIRLGRCFVWEEWGHLHWLQDTLVKKIQVYGTWTSILRWYCVNATMSQADVQKYDLQASLQNNNPTAVSNTNFNIIQNVLTNAMREIHQRKQSGKINTIVKNRHGLLKVLLNQ